MASPRPGRLSLAALAACVLASVPAGAQSTLLPSRVARSNGAGMDMHLFRPAVDSKGFFSVNGADVLGAGDLSVGLVLDYGRNFLPLREGHGAAHLLDHAFQGTVHFNYGLANIFALGFSLPVALNWAPAATDIGPTGRTTSDQGLNNGALGNVEVHAKLRVLRLEEGFGLAFVMMGGVGATGGRVLASDPGFFVWPQAVLEGHLARGNVRLAANFGYRGHFGSNPVFGLGSDGLSQLMHGTLEYGGLATAGFGVSYRPVPTVDLVAETYGNYLIAGRSDAAQRFSAEALGGLKIFVERSSYLLLAAGAGYTHGFQRADQRFVLGFIFEPSIGDRDGDRIKDDADACPDEAEDYDGFEDTRADSPPGRYGCPEPDNDGDGILDAKDRCPNTPEDRDGVQDDDGCPESSEGDRDGDGILDASDACPDEPEDKDNFEDVDGCPDLDNDGDGVRDAKDACPNEAEDKDGFEDLDGCPDPDNDKDGLADGADKCPSEPETFNGFEDEDGCPDRGRIVVRDNDIVLLDKIAFRTNSAEILGASMPIVDAIAATLTHHPELAELAVLGHADERGDEATNVKLTQERVASVVAALVARGVNASLLEPIGVGPYCPLVEGHTEAAWEKNRRVEFKVVRTQGGPTGVELLCPLARQRGVGRRPR